MFEELRLKNFQCHARLRLHFGSGVTCLLGRSDCGKSAIVRALRWLIFNRPGGNAFVRRTMENVSENCAVQLAIDGRFAGRHRGGRRGNVYTLDRSTLRAFGTGTPDAINTLFNLGTVNLQNQHDPPFWLTLSPGECARALNEVVNLSLIDRVLTAAGQEVRQIKAQIETAEKQLTEAKRHRDELAWVRRADKVLRAVEEQYTKVKLIHNKLARLADLLQEGRRLVEAKNYCQRAANALQMVVAAGAGLQQGVERITKLGKLVHSITDTNSKLLQASETVKRTEDQLRQETQGRACPVCGRALR